MIPPEEGVIRAKCGAAIVTSEEREQMICLCERIQEEQNPKKFLELVEELNRLIDEKQARIARIGTRRIRT